MNSKKTIAKALRPYTSNPELHLLAEQPEPSNHNQIPSEHKESISSKFEEIPVFNKNNVRVGMGSYVGRFSAHNTLVKSMCLHKVSTLWMSDPWRLRR